MTPPPPPRAGGRPKTVGAFVRARRPAWERLDALAARAGVEGGSRLRVEEVEELDRLSRRAAGDLAFARRAYPGSDAEGYLSELVARTFAALHRPPRPGLAALLRALGEAPATCRAHASALALSATFLVAGIAGGALAVAVEPAAADLLVPAGVRGAVAAKRLWTESLLSAAPGLWGGAIARNNLTVAALAFALGLTGGLGTAALLFGNGLLLGAVAVFTARGGLGLPLFGFLAAHGPAELSALVLAGQAGFVLASALVFPGEWPRARALPARGREAARLLAVAVPALLVVALVEAAISPAPGIPALAKLALGAGLAIALWGWLGRAR